MGGRVDPKVGSSASTAAADLRVAKELSREAGRRPGGQRPVLDDRRKVERGCRRRATGSERLDVNEESTQAVEMFLDLCELA
jgi:hypothetical protein